MAGKPGSGGPVPKRSDQRLGHTSKAARATVNSAPAGEAPAVPDPDPEWHPRAVGWYQSLAVSGQSAFYESSDYEMAWTAAEMLSRQLLSSRPSAQMIAAWVQISSLLLTTEGDRRRVRLELERVNPPAEDEADVSELDEYRRRQSS